MRLLIATTCFSIAAISGGKAIVLTLKDSSSVSGELLAVRSEGFVLARVPWLAEEQLRLRPEVITLVSLDSVSVVHIAGHRNPGIGAVVGMGVGMLTGAIVGYNAPVSSPGYLTTDRSLNAEMGALMGVIPGLVAGTFIGVFVETGAQEFGADDMIRLQLLPKDARYPDGEPDYLRQRATQ